MRRISAQTEMQIKAHIIDYVPESATLKLS